MDLRVGGKWKLSKKLGSGAFGEIYQGKYNNQVKRIYVNYYFSNIGVTIKTGEEVAIKLVS